MAIVNVLDGGLSQSAPFVRSNYPSAASDSTEGLDYFQALFSSEAVIEYLSPPTLTHR